MIKNLLILSILFSLAGAGHIRWFGNYSDALKVAQKEHKPMMVLLVKKECRLCGEVIREYFMDKSYIDLLDQKVISVIVVSDSKASYPIELFYSTIFPTLFFVDSQNESFLSDPFYGCVEGSRLKNEINRILQPAQ